MKSLPVLTTSFSSLGAAGGMVSAADGSGVGHARGRLARRVGSVGRQGAGGDATGGACGDRTEEAATVHVRTDAFLRNRLLFHGTFPSRMRQLHPRMAVLSTMRATAARGRDDAGGALQLPPSPRFAPAPGDASDDASRSAPPPRANSDSPDEPPAPIPPMPPGEPVPDLPPVPIDDPPDEPDLPPEGDPPERTPRACAPPTPPRRRSAQPPAAPNNRRPRPTPQPRHHPARPTRAGYHSRRAGRAGDARARTGHSAADPAGATRNAPARGLMRCSCGTGHQPAKPWRPGCCT